MAIICTHTYQKFTTIKGDLTQKAFELENCNATGEQRLYRIWTRTWTWVQGNLEDKREWDREREREYGIKRTGHWTSQICAAADRL